MAPQCYVNIQPLLSRLSAFAVCCSWQYLAARWSGGDRSVFFMPNTSILLTELNLSLWVRLKDRRDECVLWTTPETESNMSEGYRFIPCSSFWSTEKSLCHSALLFFFFSPGGREGGCKMQDWVGFFLQCQFTLHECSLPDAFVIFQ